MKLKGKIAIVTGAGSGIGRAIAYKFSAEGATLIVADIDKNGGGSTVSTITNNGQSAIFLHTDIASAASVENMIKSVVEKYGKIDILVNNAGTFMEDTLIENITESTWDKMFDVNVKSMFLTAKYAVPLMKAQGGVIINMASKLGHRPRATTTAYSSSKGAVIILTKSMALELAKNGIRVNCISPGLTETPMLKDTDPAFKVSAANMCVNKRLNAPDDIASAALFLASEEASNITGVNLPVDGGMGI